MKQSKCQEQNQRYQIVEKDENRFLVDSETGEFLGEVLSDKNSVGKEKPWAEKKRKNLLLAQAYRDVSDVEMEELSAMLQERGLILDASMRKENYWTKKAKRIENCATLLRFGLFDMGDEGVKKQLIEMHTCQVRLCPLCTWRRSRKTQTQMRKILDAMAADGKNYAYIFATFTVPNVSGEELKETIRSMTEAWNRFRGYKAFDMAVKGWFRSLEVTHNVNPQSKSYDTYHPHLHCIFAVNQSYFNDKTYLSRAKWLALWQKATRNRNIKEVWVEKVKPMDETLPLTGENIIKTICEVTKYTIKESGYIMPEDWDMTIASVRTLDEALARKRLTAWGGVFEEYRKKLKLDDNENGDLASDGLGDGNQVGTVCYIFHSGYQQYMLESDFWRNECEMNRSNRRSKFH